MNLEEIFKDKSESTKKNYIQRINRLKKLYFPDDNNYVFIKKPNRLIKKINGSDYPASTKRDYYIALYAVDPIEKYKNEMYKFRDETNKKQGESTISEEKLKNYDTMKNLRKILDIMPEDTYIQVRDKLLVSIYLLKPPIRNDLESVAIFKKLLDPSTNNTLNYIQKKDKEFIFYLNQYKTVKKYGAKKIIYSKSEDPEIYNLFKKIMKFNKPFLIVNDTNNNPLDDKQISALIIKIFENYLNKHVSINTIRHIYETELINSEEYKKMSMTQKKAKHDELMHDFTTAHTDYNKINMPQEEEQIPLIPMKPQKMYRAKLIKLEEAETNLKPKKKVITKLYKEEEEIKPKEPTIKYNVDEITKELNKNKPIIKFKTEPLMITYINFDDLTLPELKQLAIDYNNKFIIKITKTENEKQVLKNKAELLKDIKYFLKVNDNNKIVSRCLDLELNLVVNESKNINEDIKAYKKSIKTSEKYLSLKPDDEERQNILIQQKEQLAILENKVEEKPPKKVKVINLDDEKPTKKEKVEKVEKIDKSQNIEIEKDIKEFTKIIKDNEKKYKGSAELTSINKIYYDMIETLKKKLV